MNQFRIILAASAAMAALAIGVPSAAHPDHSTKEEVREIKIVHADGRKHISKAEFVAECGKGRKFESSATTGDEKNKNVNKMLICSDPGESDAEWRKTLSDALARVEANSDMNPEGKAKITADLKAEIAKTEK